MTPHLPKYSNSLGTYLFEVSINSTAKPTTDFKHLQNTLTRLSIFGRDFSVSLISRRSRHFAGTRILIREVTIECYANELVDQ
ncbi:hypothetical protein RJ639_039790 [Escallonia herrerae]|uniref:SAC domain-containing protein n=1 Tax=Escallonia herrerae TaxID=1293975 RepID=A0AA89BCS2_9ASTE|nr:hypothetical protein RJ639_039790 [Escallonia herrerae]